MMIAREDHEWQYNPRLSVPGFERYAARAAELSRAARGRRPGRCDIAYGPTPLSTLDVFPAGRTDAPLHVFLHGGYWRGRDKADYSYLADALVPHGVTVVVMNYDLCPRAELPAIAAQVREGLRWIHGHAAELGGDPDRLTASGHSAGAHLVAMALAGTGTGAEAGRLPEGMLKAAVLISGIYELEPVLGISVNETIRLRPEQVDALSPMRRPPGPGTRLDIVAGGAETPAWKAQSRDFAQACRQRGADCTHHEIAGQDHFSIMTLAETPEGPLARRLLSAAEARP